MSVEAPGVSISAGAASVSGPAISVGRPSYEAVPSIIQQAEEVAATAWAASEPASIIKQAEEVATISWEAPRPAAIEIRQPQVETVVLPAESGALSAAGAVVEAEYWLAMHQADRVQAARVIEVASQAGIKPEVSSRWVVNALPVSQNQVGLETRSETKLVSEEIKREALGQEEKMLQQESRQESSQKIVSSYQEDEETLAYRLAKAKAVISHLYQGNQQAVEGSSVASALGEETAKDRSQVFKQLGINDLPDGSYTNWRQEVRSWPQLDLKTALKRVHEAALRHFPIKIGQSGRSAPPQNVAEVFRSATSPQMIFEERQELVEQEDDPVSIEPSVEVVETKIEDYPQLTEVFKQISH